MDDRPEARAGIAATHQELAMRIQDMPATATTAPPAPEARPRAGAVRPAQDTPLATDPSTARSPEAAAERQARRATAYLTVADAGTAVVGDTLQEMRDLALRSANDTLSPEQRRRLEIGYAQRGEMLSHVVREARFEGTPLFQGKTQALQAGPDGKPLAVQSADLSDLEDDFGTVAEASGARTSLPLLEKALSRLDESRSRLDDASRRLVEAWSPEEERPEALRDPAEAERIVASTRQRIQDDPSSAMAGQGRQDGLGMLTLLR